VRSSLWVLEFCKTIFMTFVTLGGEASYMARRHPRAPKVVVSRVNVCKGPLCLRKERSKSYWSEQSGWKRQCLELTISGQLKLSQRRRIDHIWWFWTSANRSPCSSFGLPSYVLALQFAWVTSWHCLILYVAWVVWCNSIQFHVLDLICNFE
jgi:hypothetical protein